MPPIPDPHTLAVLVLTGVALILFTRDNIPLESSSLLVIVLLAVGFEVFPYHGEQGELKVEALFHGFGHEALIAVCALMIAGQGLVRTGALEPIGRVLSTLWGTHPGITLLATLIVAAVFSAFVNNTPIVVLLLPVLTSVALRTGTAPASILMPMGLATLVGGMATTIGTSTNLLVVSVAADLDLPRFGMFDFAMPVVVAGSLGLLYLWLLAPRMIPDRSAPLSDLSPRLFSAQLRLTEESKAVGESLSDATRRAGGDMKVSRIRRDDDVYIVPLPDAVLREGDSLVLTDTPQNLKEFESALGATLFSGDQPVDDEHPLTAVDQQMAELVVVHGSPADGHTLRALRFLERYQLAVLALHRAGRMMDPRGASVADITLRTGDVLLVQGSTEQVQKVKQDNELLILDATSDVPKTRKASMALMILCAIVLCAAVGILPIAVSASAGALLMILTGCLSWRDATNALSAPVVLIVAASLALGASPAADPRHAIHD